MTTANHSAEHFHFSFYFARELAFDLASPKMIASSMSDSVVIWDIHKIGKVNVPNFPHYDTVKLLAQTLKYIKCVFESVIVLCSAVPCVLALHAVLAHTDLFG